MSLQIVYGYFCPTMVELSSCDRDHVAYKTWDRCYLGLCRKSLLILDLKIRHKEEGEVHPMQYREAEVTS